MSPATPTCNHCGTKFPGKELCRNCGQDPNSRKTTADAIRLATQSLKKLAAALTVDEKDKPKLRRTEKAHLRSVRNSTSVGRKKKKHGRP